ncbi:hypothetical protein LTS15_002108 [Exophiala xenobiotica]|nr:hypothetical protein LTS15_002108 [Exophiala xenobiotica]
MTEIYEYMAQTCPIVNFRSVGQTYWEVLVNRLHDIPTLKDTCVSLTFEKAQATITRITVVKPNPRAQQPCQLREFRDAKKEMPQYWGAYLVYSPSLPQVRATSEQSPTYAALRCPSAEMTMMPSEASFLLAIPTKFLIDAHQDRTDTAGNGPT